MSDRKSSPKLSSPSTQLKLVDAAPMRICFLSHSSHNGGAERVLLETIEVLQMQGAECRVLLPSRGELCQELGRLGVPFSIVSFPLWMSRGKARFALRCRAAFGILVNTLMIAWSIHRWGCDIVYSNTATVCVGGLASRLVGRPHIWHLHEFGLEDQALSFLFGDNASLALINRLSSRCICVSHALASKYAQSIDPSKIVVIYPSMHLALKDGTDSTQFESCVTSRKRFRCVIVGTLMEGKGQGESVLAFARLREIGIDAELLVVGDGLPDYCHFLGGLVRSNQLEDRVTFVGQVRDALTPMRSSDAVLVCSKSEAFGRVTIEGMFVGKPVIGARSGATAELIQDGVNGLLYNQGDPSDLAAKIEYLYKNPGIANELGRNGQSWVEKCFTQERYAGELIAVLKSLSLPIAKVIGPAPAV